MKLVIQWDTMYIKWHNHDEMDVSWKFTSHIHCKAEFEEDETHNGYELH